MDLPTVEDLVPARGASWQAGDAFLAGGSWLFSEPQPDVRRLLDLTSYGWPALVADPSGLEIAATCTLSELASYRAPAPLDWPAVALFAQSCEALLGSFKVRNVATVGGNICLALPAGPMTALTAALDGVCTLWSADGTTSRRGVVDVVVGPGRTALAPGQLLRSIRLPASTLRSRVAFRQASLTTLGGSATVVIGRVALAEALITITAATQRPLQLRYAELPGAKQMAHDLDLVVGNWNDDVHGSPHWRRAMTHRLINEVVDELCDAPTPNGAPSAASRRDGTG
jgi:CO/xanthine dehydrogenase FAD-binding subunit